MYRTPLIRHRTPTGCIYASFANTQPREDRKHIQIALPKILYFATAVEGDHSIIGCVPAALVQELNKAVCNPERH